MAGWIRPSIYVHGCTIRCVCVYGCNRQGIAWLRAKRVDRKEIPLLTLGRRGHAPQRNVATPRESTAPAATTRRHRRHGRLQSAPTKPTHHSPFTIHHSPFTIQHSTFNIQHSTFNIQHSTFTIQHSTFNITPTPPLFL